MLWLVFGFITAFSLSTSDALSKRALSSTEAIVIAWVREGYALPFLALSFLFIDIPHLDRAFWLSVAALLPLEITAVLLYVRAISLSPLSLSVPFMAFSPVFIIFIAFFVLGEVPTRSGVAGVLLIALGAYLLNASASRYGVLGPIRAITKEKGSLLMVVVSFIYSITSVIGKIAIEHSGPVFFGFFYPFALTLILTVIVWSKGRLPMVFSKPGTFFPIGFFSSLMVVTHFMGLSLTQVAYLISVKRTSLIMSVIYGKFLFSEEKIKERLAGGVVMALGVALIVLSS